MPSKPKKPAAPNLIIIGGREDRDGSCTVLQEIASRAASGKLVIVTLASDEPQEQWKSYARTFTRLGVKKVVQLHYEKREDALSSPKADVFDGAAVIFFGGGDQMKLVSRIAGTPFYDRLFELVAEGVTIAGTSAGAAAMSETMLVGPRESDETNKVGSAFQTASGLGLIEDVIIDQHFAERSRMARLLGAVAEKPSALGIGIDEDTAAVVQGTTMRVVGSGAVYIVDGQGLTYTNVSETEYDRTMAIFDVRLHVLKAGNSFDLATRRPTVNKNEKDTGQPGIEGKTSSR